MCTNTAGSGQSRERREPAAVTVFVTAPVEELERRLRRRATESSGAIEERIATARRQLAEQGQFDFVVANDDRERAANDLAAIVAQELDHWRTALDGVVPLDLPTDHTRPLTRDPHGAMLVERGVLYAPDYVINGGGIIRVAGQIYDWDDEEIERRVLSIGPTLSAIFKRAEAEGQPPAEVDREHARVEQHEGQSGAGRCP